jgi:hypothetical protein
MAESFFIVGALESNSIDQCRLSDEVLHLSLFESLLLARLGKFNHMLM